MPAVGSATEIETLIVGGGIVGAAAALEAARRAPGVALVEQASLVSSLGSSRGSARIYAPAAYPDEEHLHSGLAALSAWRGIEADADSRLLYRTGALSIGAFALESHARLAEAGVEAELMSPGAVRRRFGLDLDDRPIVHQVEAGVIHAHRARHAVLTLAERHGAAFHPGETILDLVPEDGLVRAVTDRHEWRCGSVIVAAGPWAGALLRRSGLESATTVTRQTVAYFDWPASEAPPPALMDFEGDEPYALWDPERGLKASLHERGPRVAPSLEPGAPDPRAVSRLEDWVHRRYPAVTGPAVHAETCLYTNTSDERFAYRRNGRIVSGAVCNGQGFQSAPESGRRLVELALQPAGVTR